MTSVEVGVDGLPRPDRRRLERIIAAAVPSVAPALALGVWQAGQPVIEIQAGTVDPDEPGRPLPADALFDLASLSKLFTTSAFLGLVSDGVVGLEDAVISVLPEFGASGPRGVDGGQDPLSRRLLATPTERGDWMVDPAAVTFRQLLTHTGGLAPWRSIFRETGPVPPMPAQDDGSSIEHRRRAGLAAVFGYPFVARPGTEFHYSDLGFMLLGEAVARLGQAGLDDVLSTRITHPLGLGSVTFAPARSGVAIERIVPTSFDDDWRMRRCLGEVEDENAAGLGGIAGHAGLFGSARDIAAFGQAWLSVDARLGIDAHLVAAAIDDQTDGLGVRRGLGWQIRGVGSEHLTPFAEGAFGHTGFTGTSLAVDPSRGTVVALLTNRVYRSRTHEGIEDLRSQVHQACADALG